MGSLLFLFAGGLRNHAECTVLDVIEKRNLDTAVSIFACVSGLTFVVVKI